MAGACKVARALLFASFGLAIVVGCVDSPSTSRRAERGDGSAPSVTIDESVRQWRARRGDTGSQTSTVHPPAGDPPGVYRGPASGGTAGSSSPYVGASPGLPSIPMRPDATTIPLPGRTTFPLPGGTTIPTPIDPLSPNPATVTVPTPSR